MALPFCWEGFLPCPKFDLLVSPFQPFWVMAPQGLFLVVWERKVSPKNHEKPTKRFISASLSRSLVRFAFAGARGGTTLCAQALLCVSRLVISMFLVCPALVGIFPRGVLFRLLRFLMRCGVDAVPAHFFPCEDILGAGLANGAQILSARDKNAGTKGGLMSRCMLQS